MPPSVVRPGLCASALAADVDPRPALVRRASASSFSCSHSDSSDSDEGLVRDFLSKNQMEWPECLDRDKRFQQTCEIRAWPTYVVIDDEGIVRFRTTGTSPATGARLEDEIRRQLKIAAARLESN